MSGLVNVGQFTTTSSVSVSVNSIVGSPGGSETLTNAKHFNFLSYSGGTGTYTITLPPAEDGIILRFKTNDTIAANKTITLQGDGSERIDAESSFILSRPYDGISILGKDSLWFIIQQKEK